MSNIRVLYVYIQRGILGKPDYVEWQKGTAIDELGLNIIVSSR